LSLYAALDTQSGKVLGKTAVRNTSQEFVGFLTEVVERAPAREVHIILDNLSAHKSQVVRDFLGMHPNVHFHFTPTYSSWLNQVEIWFSKVERNVIARGILTSVKDLPVSFAAISTPIQRTLSRSGGNIPIRPAASAVTLSLPHATSSSQIVIVMR
jgi:transposase